MRFYMCRFRVLTMPRFTLPRVAHCDNGQLPTARTNDCQA
jgi:hypothetical protein